MNAVSLEFARRGDEDLQLFKEFDAPFSLGLGVVDVKSHDVESPGFVADRIRRALDVVPAERLVVNPDCGCMHLPRDVAFNKLSAMVEGARLVRSEPGSMNNPLPPALKAGRFCYVVELVASALKREAQVLEIGSDPHGAADCRRQHHELRRRRLRPGLRARRHRRARARAHAERAPDLRQPGSRRAAEDAGGVQALEMYNVFALTGDWPKGSLTPPAFDLDAVQLTEMIAEPARQARRAVPHRRRRLAVQVRA